MKKLRLLGVVPLPIAMSTMTLAGGQDRGGNAGLCERFVGAWQLAGLEAEGADGKIHRADATGLLVFTQRVDFTMSCLPENSNARGRSLPIRVRTSAPSTWKVQVCVLSSIS
jgi:hypothetical protein